jgi:hypothetical protein
MVAAGDNWLSQEIPQILASDAYKRGGAIFITWDEESEDENSETEHASDGPTGMIVLAPRAKKGCANAIPYNHRSTVRTMETIFDVPYLRGASQASDLGDLFTP